MFKFCFWYRSSDDPNDCKWGGWWGVWDGIKLKAQYLNSDNSMILIFQYHFWNISIINTIKCIIALDWQFLIEVLQLCQQLSSTREDCLMKQDHLRMNVAPDQNSHLSSTDLFRSLDHYVQ